jgi:hypothetical protein
VIFGLTVVNGDVDVVNAGIQDSIQDAFGLAGSQRSSDPRNHAAQL